MHISPNDPKQYRYLTLDNELKVLLVHDADAPALPPHCQSMSVILMIRLNDRVWHTFWSICYFSARKSILMWVSSRHLSTKAVVVIMPGPGQKTRHIFFEVSPHAFSEGLDRFGQFFLPLRSLMKKRLIKNVKLLIPNIN